MSHNYSSMINPPSSMELQNSQKSSSKYSAISEECNSISKSQIKSYQGSSISQQMSRMSLQQSDKRLKGTIPDYNLKMSDQNKLLGGSYQSQSSKISSQKKPNHSSIIQQQKQQPSQQFIKEVIQNDSTQYYRQDEPYIKKVSKPIKFRKDKCNCRSENNKCNSGHCVCFTAKNKCNHQCNCELCQNGNQKKNPIQKKIQVYLPDPKAELTGSEKQAKFTPPNF